MISFPKYKSLKHVLKAVKASTEKEATELPTIPYIGFTEPAGSKVVIELDNTGEVIGTSSKIAQKWADANTGSLSLVVSNLITAHGTVPSSITLTIAGYVSGGVLSLVDAQLAADGKHGAYWLSTSVLDQLVDRVSNVQTAFKEGAVYTEIDFNDVDLFANEVARTAADSGQTMLWQVSPHSDASAALVLRDPYRITTD
jgi:hypothetical protein